MSQSVKLSDGSYIDAGAVWDNNKGMTLEQMDAGSGYGDFSGTKTFTLPKSGTWTNDTSNAITLTEGTWLISLVFRSNSTQYIDAGVCLSNDTKPLRIESHGTLPKPVTDGNMRYYFCMFKRGATADGLSICFGGETSGTSDASVQYEISWIRLSY